MKTKQLSTFERMMANKKRKAAFDKGYEEFLLSELLIEAMEAEKKSVRALAKEAGVSPAVIQDLKSGKKTNVSVKTLLPILHALNYRLAFEKIR